MKIYEKVLIKLFKKTFIKVYKVGLTTAFNFCKM